MSPAVARPRLVIADDHRLILDAFGFLIASVATVVGTATDGAELLRVVEATQPDLVVTDLSMPEMNGIEATRHLRAMPHTPRVIVLTIHADPGIARSAFEALDDARTDPLTDREREILTLVAAGLTAKEICDRLGIAERTVNFHKKNLKARLGVGTTAEAVAWLARQSPQGV